MKRETREMEVDLELGPTLDFHLKALETPPSSLFIDSLGEIAGLSGLIGAMGEYLYDQPGTPVYEWRRED
jgi:hypothetical protein